VNLTEFTNNTAVTTFESTFENCASLQQIPNTLFDSNINTQNFTNTFSGNFELIGNAPKLWDSSKWSNVIFNDGCFGCFTSTAIASIGSNGDTIPISWGGFCECGGDCITNCSGQS
jgi:hypothetical protein